MSAPPADVVDPLARLASRAPSRGLDPAALWSRGRRRQRKRALAAICAAVAVGFGGAAVTPELLARAREVAPVTSDGSAVLPDTIRQPGGWEPAFGRAPGRLSAVGAGTRARWWSSEWAFWGVSAMSGDSRWLDVPPTSSGDWPALSADGTRLAYWAADGVAGLRPGDDLPAPTELRILDLTTGEQQRWAPDAPHGLMTTGIAWVGDTLLFDADAFRDADQTSARPFLHMWPRGGDVADVSDRYPSLLDLTSVTPDDRGFVATRGSVAGGAWRVTSEGAEWIAFDMGGRLSTPSVSSDDQLVVGVHQTRGAENLGVDQQLLVGRIEDGRASMRRVGPVQAAEVVGWRSSTEAMVASVISDGGTAGVPGEGRPSWQVSVADVEDPVDFRFTRLLDVEASTLPIFAADAWSAETVPAPDAPFAPDPRIFGLALLAGALVGWRAIVVVRRWRERA